MDETVREFRVEGVVQGVGFRWWTRRTASRLGLRGTVRNLDDGAVEVRVAGPGDAVERLREALEEGPPGARVSRVVAAGAPAEELPREFRIVD